MGNRNSAFFLGETFEDNPTILSFVRSFTNYILNVYRDHGSLFRFNERHFADDDVEKQRLSQRSKQVEKLKNTIIQTGNTEALNAYEHDVVTTLFSEFLSNCPSPILPFELYLKLHKGNPKHFAQYVEIYLESFSNYRRQIIMNLFGLFNELLKPENVNLNRLSLMFLASTFGPLLFQEKVQITNYTALTNLFEYIIYNFYPLNIDQFQLLESLNKMQLTNANELARQIFELEEKIKTYTAMKFHSYNRVLLKKLFHFYQRRKICFQRGRLFYFWRYYTRARKIWRELDHIKSQIQMVLQQYSSRSNNQSTNPNIYNSKKIPNIINSEYDRNLIGSQLNREYPYIGMDPPLNKYPHQYTSVPISSYLPDDNMESKIFYNNNIAYQNQHNLYNNNTNAYNNHSQYQSQFQQPYKNQHIYSPAGSDDDLP